MSTSFYHPATNCQSREPEWVRVERYWAFPARTVLLFGWGGACHDGKQDRGRGNESRRLINIPFMRQGWDRHNLSRKSSD